MQEPGENGLRPPVHATAFPPAPGELAWETGVARISEDGSSAVILITHTAGIDHAFLIPPDEADRLAEQLKTSATRARTGLHLPN